MNTIQDTDRQALESVYTLSDDWWNESAIIAEALLNEQAPDMCKFKPWSTFATYMALNADVVVAFNEANATLPPNVQRAIGAVISNAATSSPSPQLTQPVATGKRPTDDELRDRWRAKHPDTAYGLGSWRVYANGIWNAQDDEIIEQQILQEIEAAKSEGISPKDTVLRSVLKLSEVTCFKPASIWDSDPDILVCSNGMLHIPTLTLQPHDQAAYQTSGVPYAYDPQAGCPTFLKAIGRLPFGVAKLIQEYAGYALTTDTKYEITLWFLGSPGSGKSTVIEGFNAMLGTRAGVLSLKQISMSRFGLSNIAGKTLLYAFENPALYLETTDVLNALVSGEAIQVERKFHDPVTIIPHSKILWAMNALPRVGGAEDGIFRRAKIVIFPPLPESEKDSGLKGQIKTEGAGILNWALMGLDRLHKNGGFTIPPEVLAATDEFHQNNDPESAFITERCEVNLLDPALHEQSSILYNSYRTWCIDNGHKPKSSTSVSNDWKRMGFGKTHIVGKVYWTGVRLLP